MAIQEMRETGRSTSELDSDAGRAAQSRGHGERRERRDRRDRGEWKGNGLTTIDEERLARGLAWFSIGLGLAEVTAPRAVEKLIGVPGEHRAVIRALGFREIAHGVGILMQRTPVEAVWSRVGGDAIDLAFLAAAFASPHAKQSRVAAATAAVLGITVVDFLCAQRLSQRAGRGALRLKKSIIINRSSEDLYRFWRDVQNLPRVMSHIESVQVTGDTTSHWVAKGPAGSKVEWDAEIIDDRPNELIAWRSLDGADVGHSGSVRFERAPGGRGTIVRVEMQYKPPGGHIGVFVAKLFGEDPELQLKDDLRRFKQVMEIGEIVRSEASLMGTGVTQQRPAQPPAQLAPVG